jgi:hypothetical protein
VPRSESESKWKGKNTSGFLTYHFHPIFWDESEGDKIFSSKKIKSSLHLSFIFYFVRT